MSISEKRGGILTQLPGIRWLIETIFGEGELFGKQFQGLYFVSRAICRRSMHTARGAQLLGHTKEVI